MDTPSSLSTDTMSDFTSKLIYFSNEFPNDDLHDILRRLQRFSKDKRFRSLSIFLEEAVVVLREEITALPESVQSLVPPFQTVLCLADLSRYRSGPLGGAMEGALLVILEIGVMIANIEGLGLTYDFQKHENTLTGLSIGLLAGAALSFSSNVTDLAVNGTESLRVAFRLGIHVDQVSQLLEPRDVDGDLNSWAYVVTGIASEDVQTELDQFNAQTANPELTKVFISAADKNSVSVTGPPARLKGAFRHSQALRYSKHYALPVYGGLCHAPHLYTEDDVNTIIGGSEPRCPHSRQVNVPLISPMTGTKFSGRDVGTLYQQIVAEILSGTIYLDKMTSGMLKSVSNSGRPECQVLLFRTSLIARGFLLSIESDLPNVNVCRHDMIESTQKEFPTRMPSRPKQSKLAVVGMSCRMPGGANDLELFWKLMEEGRDVHTQVPTDRFDLSTHFDPSGCTANATETPFGNFIDKPGFFDAGFFNMSPREAEQTDPMHRLALVSAYEALEMSGYAPNRTSSTNLKRVGTYYGQASDDWREVNAGQNIGTYAVPGGERAFANGRINYFFKFSGPSYNIDTACSSGLAAVNAACSALWAGEADTVLAGGLSVITNPDNYCMLCKGHFLSKTGQCKVWDEGADGYCRADGIGSVVMKRLEDAEADNDNIIAVVASGFTNHSAEAISITHPHVGSQKANYAQVMNNAGINPLDVSYIELHGTGTQAGDAVESESVADVFAPVNPKRRLDQRLHLGAVKSNIGHGEAAAGIASFLKALLVFQKSQLPRHVGIVSQINPKISKDLEARNIGLNLENVPWPKVKGRKRYGLVNSFGAHGGNTTLLLEDPPEKLKIGEDPRSTHVITVSAKSKASLKGNIESLSSYLEEHPDTDLGDLAYTLCVRRMHHNTRVAVACSDANQVKRFLETSKESVIRPVPSTPPPVLFAFTGQGAFYQGIGLRLFSQLPYFRSQILQLDHFVQLFGFPSVVPCVEGTTNDGTSPLVTQLTIVVVEIALARTWGHLGVKPSAVVGHSLGEYAAMVAAGVVSAVDAVFLAGKRAELTLAACEMGSHLMLSVRASPGAIKETCSESYEVSCMNGSEDTVVSGPRKNIESIRADLEKGGFRCTQLDLPFAFHTAQMDPMLEPFEKIARNVSFKVPNIPFISPLLSNCVFDGKTINAAYLCRASREPVNFAGALEAAHDMGIIDNKTLCVDIGPHPICSAFLRSFSPDMKIYSSIKKNADDFATLAATLAGLHTDGVNIAWNEYFRPYEKAHELLHLNKYVWNEKDYWIPYTGTFTLDKARPKQNIEPGLGSMSSGSILRSSSIHQVISEKIDGDKAYFSAIADIMHPDLLGAVRGHMMNGHSVATSSIWADMALTVGEHLYKQLVPGSKEVHMNVSGMQVLHAQVAQTDASRAQLLQLDAVTDLLEKSTFLQWYNVLDGVRAEEAFASATVLYEDPAEWQTEWSRVKHLVEGRIDSLSAMADTGLANRLSKNMAYNLFKNVVDYSAKYRGMQTVVLNEHEAFTDINLVPERHGSWHTPPHWIDSVCHVGGFVMNGSDASNTKDYFFVTPGWGSFRLLRPLQPGAKYRSHVRMFPIDEPNMSAGDVYIFQDDEIVGMMGQMKFRSVNRVLMDRFFSPSDAKHKNAGGSQQKAKPTTPAPTAATKVLSPPPVSKPKVEDTKIETEEEQSKENKVGPHAETVAVGPSENAESNPVIADCLRLIARETGLEVSVLTDEASFVELGVDSLMSLVLSEKFRNELQLEVKSSLFIECPNIGEMKSWLEEYC